MLEFEIVTVASKPMNADYSLKVKLSTLYSSLKARGLKRDLRYIMILHEKWLKIII
jgi:hypothetical protein